MKPFIPYIVGWVTIIGLLRIISRRRNWHLNWQWLLGSLLGLTVLLALGWWLFIRPESSPSSSTTSSNEIQYVPPVLAPASVVDWSWSHQTFDIPAQGLSVYLYPGWKDFAFGGAITITTPSGQVLRDRPGVNNQWGFQPEGLYIFRPDPVRSRRSVQIYNQWGRTTR